MAAKVSPARRPASPPAVPPPLWLSAPLSATWKPFRAIVLPTASAHLNGNMIAGAALRDATCTISPQETSPRSMLRTACSSPFVSIAVSEGAGALRYCVSCNAQARAASLVPLCERHGCCKGCSARWQRTPMAQSGYVNRNVDRCAAALSMPCPHPGCSTKRRLERASLVLLEYSEQVRALSVDPDGLGRTGTRCHSASRFRVVACLSIAAAVTILAVAMAAIAGAFCAEQRC